MENYWVTVIELDTLFFCKYCLTLLSCSTTRIPSIEMKRKSKDESLINVYDSTWNAACYLTFTCIIHDMVLEVLHNVQHFFIFQTLTSLKKILFYQKLNTFLRLSCIFIKHNHFFGGWLFLYLEILSLSRPVYFHAKPQMIVNTCSIRILWGAFFLCPCNTMIYFIDGVCVLLNNVFVFLLDYVHIHMYSYIHMCMHICTYVF